MKTRQEGANDRKRRMLRSFCVTHSGFVAAQVVARKTVEDDTNGTKNAYLN